MVRLLLFFGLVCPPLFAQVGELILEYSRNRVYQGEQIQADFYLLTPLRSLQLEVAKFPEFRGYWKENTMLRQGRISMVFEPAYTSRANKLWRRVRVGSYNIIPMLGEEKPTVRPMHVVLKYQEAGEEKETTLSSQSFRDLTIQPLPPIRNPEWKKAFRGAVGNFRLNTLRTKIPFSEGEAAQVEFTLDGEGNFQEINQLTEKLVVPFEIVSDWSTLSSTGSYFVKSFQWTFSMKRRADFELPPIPFVFFDPEQGQYRYTATSPVLFVYQPRTEVAPAPDSTLAWPAVQKHWRGFRPWSDSPWFWGTHLLGLFGLCFPLGIQFIQRRTPAKPPKSSRLDAVQILGLWREENPDSFLRNASLWIEQELQESQIENSRKRMLAKSSKPAEWLQDAETFFRQADQALFSPHPPKDTKSLAILFEKLAQKKSA